MSIIRRRQERHGTTAQALASTEPLLLAELGIDTDTGELKIGDGASLWAGLPALGGGGGDATGDLDLLLSLDADRFDLFDRPDGPFVDGLMLPSGQVWRVTGDVSGSVMGPELKTVGGALTYDNRNGTRAKAYMWSTAAPFTRFAAVFSFGPGTTTNATIGFIISPRSTADTAGIPTSNGVNGVATNSIHGSFGPNSWSFLMFKSGAMSPVFASSGLDGTWAAPLEVDRRYSAAIERLAVDAMRIWLPAPRIGNAPRYIDVTDAMILARTGVADKIADLWPETGVQSALIEFLNPLTPSLATDRQASFHGYACYGGGKVPRLASAPIAAADLAFDPATQTELDAVGATASAALPSARTKAIRKTAAESVLNSATLQDDDELSFAVDAGEVWEVEVMALVDGSTTGDVRVGLAGPAGSTGSVVVTGMATNATTAFGAILAQTAAVGASINAGTVGAGTTIPITLRATVVVGGTAGAIRLQWAQVAVDAVVPTRVLANSNLRATRIA